MTDPYSGSIQLIRKKRKKNLIHEIYRYDHTLVKRFIKIAPLPDMRRPWQMEDAALRRLEGLGVPETYGFSIKKKNKKTGFERRILILWAWGGCSGLQWRKSALNGIGS